MKDDINRGVFIDRQRKGVVVFEKNEKEKENNVRVQADVIQETTSKQHCTGTLRRGLSESLEQTICVIKYETMTHQRQLISNIHLDTKQKLFDYRNHIFISLNHNVENKGSK